jgi:hypothetical protein
VLNGAAKAPNANAEDNATLINFLPCLLNIESTSFY